MELAWPDEDAWTAEELERACIQAERCAADQTPPTGDQQPSLRDPLPAKRARFLPSTLSSAVPPPQPFLPYLAYNGKVVYASDESTVDACCRKLLEAKPDVLGFDMEWRVEYQSGKSPRPVALLQLAYRETVCAAATGSASSAVAICSDAAAAIAKTPCSLIQCAKHAPPHDVAPPSCCLLLHIAHAGLPPSLCEILSTPLIRKVGCGIINDAHKLRQDHGIDLNGLICLSEYANARIDTEQAPKTWSLGALAQRLLGGRLHKQQHMRCSDWEKRPLTAAQKLYSSTDAWVSLRLYETLKPLQLLPIPKHVQLELKCEATPSAKAAGISEARGNASFKAQSYLSGHMECKPLQPAKKNVLELHLEGLAVSQIAELRKIKRETIMSYLAEAITLGYPYTWKEELLGVDEAQVALVADMIEHKMGLCLPLRWKAPLATCAGTTQDPGCKQEGTRELLKEMIACMCPEGGIRQLKEQVFDDGLSYGELRLVLAHLGRCNPRTIAVDEPQ